MFPSGSGEGREREYSKENKTEPWTSRCSNSRGWGRLDTHTEGKRTAAAKAHSGNMEAVFRAEKRGLGGGSRGSGYGPAEDEAGNMCQGHVLVVLVPG